jgi:hypothetical protein
MLLQLLIVWGGRDQIERFERGPESLGLLDLLIEVASCYLCDGPHGLFLALNADRPDRSIPSDDVEAMLALAAPSVTYKRRVPPLLLECVSAKLLELIPAFGGRVIVMNVLDHRCLNSLFVFLILGDLGIHALNHAAIDGSTASIRLVRFSETNDGRSARERAIAMTWQENLTVHQLA